MSELDDLPSWAGRSTEEVQLPVDPPEQAPVPTEAAPEPPMLPDEPEVAAAAGAEPGTSTQAEAPIDDPGATQDAETPIAEDPAADAPAAEAPAEAAEPQDEPTVLAQPSITAPAAAAVGAAATQAPPVTEPVRVEPAVTTKRTSRLRPLLLGLLGLGILAGAAAVGYAVASRDGDATEATGTASADTAEDPAAPSSDTGTDAGTSDADASETATDGAASEDEAGTEGGDGTEGEDGTETVTVEVDEDADDASGDADADAEAETDAGSDGEAPLNDGDRQAIFRDGKVYLSGAVPSEEIGAAIVAKAEAVVGAGNVVNEYTIDPSTTIVPGSSAPLYVEDVVLFEFNSIEVARPFLPILDLGTLLLRQNPQASVTVVTRTDAVGSEEVNLEVARRRAQAVINYWLGQGVNADQILADPRGEEGASEDDDAETAARQRRAEFIITGLLD